MTESKLSAGVVLYQPNPNVILTLNCYADHFNTLYLVNNGSAESIDFLSILRNRENVIFISYGENLGIGRALNDIIVQSRIDRMDGVFLFDQDSSPNGKMLEKMEMSMINFPDVGVFVPHHVTRDGRIVKVDHAIGNHLISITSGMLVNLSIVKNDIIHDESLFIDYVDIDFFIKAIAYKIKVKKVDTAFLSHELGNPESIKIFGFRLLSTNHSSSRRYYIAKNRMVIFKRYFVKYPFWSIRQLRRYFTEVISIILIDKNKKRKLSNYFLGIVHGVLDSKNHKGRSDNIL